MAIPTAAEEVRLLDEARQRRLSLAVELADAAAGGEAVERMCARAGDAVNRYSTELLHALLAAARPLAAGDLSWLEERYLQAMIELGRAACDAMKESGTRHAVAQAVQCQILQHEHELQARLAAALASSE